MIALRAEDGHLIGYYEKHEFRNRETMPFLRSLVGGSISKVFLIFFQAGKKLLYCRQIQTENGVGRSDR